MKKTLLLASIAVASLTSVASAQDLKVCVSWSNFREERWKTDEAAIKGALDAAGAAYISADAQTSATKQLADIEGMITQGCSALIILAQDSASIGPALDAAADAGVPVVGYDQVKVAFFQGGHGFGHRVHQGACLKTQKFDHRS